LIAFAGPADAAALEPHDGPWRTVQLWWGDGRDVQEAAIMAPGMEYGLSDAVDLFSQQAAIVINLWTVYVVATFATAGFAVSSNKPLNTYILIFVTIGFWLFAIGHLQLLRQSLHVIENLRYDIKEILANLKNNPSFYFESSIQNLIETANPPWISTSIHIAIDVCATAALWIQGSRMRPIRSQGCSVLSISGP
jgi:hypothetical protein